MEHLKDLCRQAKEVIENKDGICSGDISRTLRALRWNIENMGIQEEEIRDVRPVICDVCTAIETIFHTKANDILSSMQTGMYDV
mmetsp:Transcript_26410/g.67390  ORF Transcript_26410/g.67390 Transcript_26410/m.67390 type:complete len:84 (+) Transcript_26410:1263-1514(+)